LVTQIQFEDGHMIPAWKWGKAEKHEELELTPEEEQLQEKIRTIWSAILSGQAIEEHTDFLFQEWGRVNGCDTPPGGGDGGGDGK
jgi:hypothetical protein